MARPTCFELTWDLRNDFSSIVDKSNEWRETDAEKKKELCIKYGVALPDYMDTPSLTCKI